MEQATPNLAPRAPSPSLKHSPGALRALWHDDRGFIISAELVLISTVVVLGLIAGLTCVRDAVTGELNDVADAIGSLDQSYCYTGFSGCWDPCCGIHSFTAGSCFSDEEDLGDEDEFCFDCRHHSRRHHDADCDCDDEDCRDHDCPDCPDHHGPCPDCPDHHFHDDDGQHEEMPAPMEDSESVVEPPVIQRHIEAPLTVQPPAIVEPVPQAGEPLYVPYSQSQGGSLDSENGPIYVEPYYPYPPPAEVWRRGVRSSIW